MTQSSITQGPDSLRSLAGAVFSRAARDWGRAGAGVRGPLLTVAVAVVLDVLARRGTALIHPFPALLLTVVCAAYWGGLWPAMVSAVVTTVYAAHFFSQTRPALHYTPSGMISLLLVGASASAVAVVVARLRTKANRAEEIPLTQKEVEALDRRLSFLEQVGERLASSLEYEVTLRDLARLMVSGLADWCTIHVATEQGMLQFVAGAHREPTRDLVVRALCEYGVRGLPFGEPGTTSDVTDVGEELLRQRAEDAEHLKLYRALTPAWVLRVPLHARGRTLGVLTLVTSSESGRRFETEDVKFAEELAARSALAVDNAHLHREAVEADRRFRLLFDANPQPMWVFDVETLVFLAVNDAAIRHYGYSRDEFLRMSIMDILHPEDGPGLTGSLDRGPQREGVALAQHQRKDGSIVDMEIVSHALEVDGHQARLVLATDITERTRTRAALHQSEEQLRHAQRMDAVGRIASGVAHDFNNILTTVRGFGEMLLRDLDPADRRRADVDRICQAADRGALLTRQLLSFGRRQALQPRPTSLNELLRGMQGFVQRLVGADIQVSLRLIPGTAKVRIDPGQLEQLVVNLILNARDAMPSGGTLTIETSERQISRAGRGRHVRPGRYVVLAISDTGSELDVDSLPHPFEGQPTQGQGRRAGLGLSLVYGIVRQNGGAVRVTSEPEEGTTVKIYLPLHDEDDEPEPLGEDASFGGTETVLVVEDEEPVRELLRKMLDDHGYTVLEAPHGREALLMVQRYQQPIHLLVTDVVMPEMGGRELVEALTPLYPEIRVLYVSGYTDDEVLRRGVSEVELIHKPFTADELLRKIRGLLDAARR
jgi:two-component system cell cycle sensor histidine kinase/response regulator CckA